MSNGSKTGKAQIIKLVFWYLQCVSIDGFTQNGCKGSITSQNYIVIKHRKTVQAKLLELNQRSYSNNSIGIMLISFFWQRLVELFLCN